jgi:hypothetical protein
VTVRPLGVGLGLVVAVAVALVLVLVLMLVTGLVMVIGAILSVGLAARARLGVEGEPRR